MRTINNIDNFYEKATGEIGYLVRAFAEFKNVALTENLAAIVVDDIAEKMDFSEIHALAHDANHPEHVKRVMNLADPSLDEVAAAYLVCAMARTEQTPPLHDKHVALMVGKVVAEIKATTPDQYMRWPDPDNAAAVTSSTDKPFCVYEEAPDGSYTAWICWKNGLHHGGEGDHPAVDISYRDGSKRLIFLRHGKMHRETSRGPAFHHVGDGVEVREYWVDGKLSRDPKDGPAVIMKFANGNYREEFWLDGVRHRDPADGPALVERNDEHYSEAYWVDGHCHRDPAEGPAVTVTKHEGGGLKEYWVNGRCHRAGAPACFITFADGTTQESYYSDGVLHRDHGEGPAVIQHDADGRVGHYFWINGEIRAPADGPFMIEFRPDGTCYEQDRVDCKVV